jgi:hypothetical protein
VLYIVILYLYAGKIVILWSWPKGIVSYLIACVAVLGILTLLLIHPYGNLSGNTWIKKFSKAYYFVLVPLVVLLFIAIGMRINDYGVTVNRYVIVLLGIWLAIVSTYFIIGKENIKFIPISLAVILIFVSFGYWGIFSVSERSQVARLQAILEQGNILKKERIQQEVMWLRDSLPRKLYAVDKEETNVLQDSLHTEVKSILDYLDDHHGFTSIRGWFEQDLDSIVKKSNIVNTRWMRMNEAEAYMRSMGLAYEHKYSFSSQSHFLYTAAFDGVEDVTGFDYLLDFEGQHYRDDDDIFHVGNTRYEFFYPTLPDNYAWLVSNKDSIKFEVGALIKLLEEKYGSDSNAQIPEGEMMITWESQNLSARLQLHEVSLSGDADSLEINRLDGIILLRVKE